jgi:hypothetical protein
MKWPLVSRDRYDEVRADLVVERYRVASLLEQVIALKQAGFVQPRIPKPATSPEPASSRDMDDIGRDGAKRDFVRQMTGDLMKTGISESTARTEAERIAGEMYRTYGDE